MLNLDTHVLLHALTGELKASERRLLRSQQWSISAIVLWEIAKLAQSGRIAADLQSPEFVRALGRVHVWPLTRAIAFASTQLDFQSDPADEIIAATSVVHQVPLLTRDRAIFGSKMVPLASPRASER